MDEIKDCARYLLEHVGRKARLTLSSRDLKPDDVFFAVRGTKTDGRLFIEKAAQAGAGAVVAEAFEEQRQPEVGVPIFEVRDLYRKAGCIASEYYGAPSAQMRGIAVTGTNGKTTSSFWAAELLSRLGEPCAVIGTMGCFFEGKKIDAVGLTTPDPLTLQTELNELKSAGARAFAVEASSIALELGRLNGTRIEVGIFTNLTRDHLDFHGSMENYRRAKELLFAFPELKGAVINFDDPSAPFFEAAAKAAGKKILRTGIKGMAPEEVGLELFARDISHSRQGLRFEVVYGAKKAEFEGSFLGTFNIENMLGVAGAALLSGFDFEEVLQACAFLTPPPGRMQLIVQENAPLAVVDYSHTPDAISKALEATEEMARVRGGRVWIVVGAGGDRDPGKRPLMAQAACQAYSVVLTSDNPRSEDPEEILRQMQKGLTKSALIISDRKEAIRQALGAAHPDDVVLIAGKGHEDYQEIKGVKHHFSDAQEAQEALSLRAGAPSLPKEPCA